MTVKFTTVPSKRLAETINGSSYSFALNNITGWNGSNISASDFGTEMYASFRNTSGTLLELMKIDPSTIASASIVILKRGLGFDGDQTTEVTANIQDVWVKGDTIVEIGSHFPQLLEETVRKSGDQTVAGKKTFSSVPDTTGGDAVADNDLVRFVQARALLTGSTTVNRIVVVGTAGETIAKDQLIYLKASDGRWWLADADIAATAENVILGISQGNGTTGNTITSGVLTQGLHTFTTLTLTANTKYYVSNTAGGFSSTFGTNEISVGITQSTTTIMFFPRYDQQLTEDQQDALGGTSGTPSITNKFETDNDTTNGASKTATTISFTAASKTISDSANGFVTAGFRAGASITITGSASNNGTFTIVSVAVGAIVVAETLVNESVGATVVMSTVRANKIIRVDTNGNNPIPSTNYQGFTASGTWTKPTGLTGNEIVTVQLWGGGGGGGGNGAGSAGAAAGGGGGSYSEAKFRVSDLGSTVTVTIGAGGAGGVGLNPGAIGGNTTFGSLLTAFGGGGGGESNAGNVAGGGGGGGVLSAGSSGSASATGLGGGPSTSSTGGVASHFGGGNGGTFSSGTNGGASGWGGGGGSAGSPLVGGASLFGGGGGGGGFTVSSGAGGASAIYGGVGGAGGNNGNGSNGTAPAGGGGGAGNNSGAAKNGGAGARGECRVWVTYLAN